MTSLCSSDVVGGLRVRSECTGHSVTLVTSFPITHSWRWLHWLQDTACSLYSRNRRNISSSLIKRIHSTSLFGGWLPGIGPQMLLQFLSSESACGMRRMITESEDRWYGAPAGPSAATICLEGIITHVPALPDVRCTFQICKHWEVTSGIFVTSKDTAIITNFSFITWPLHVHNVYIIDKTERGFFSYKSAFVCSARYSLLHFISIWRSLYTSGSMIILFSHKHYIDAQWRRSKKRLLPWLLLTNNLGVWRVKWCMNTTDLSERE
jgi:hypothetical protein